ncbi:cupin domain-containing protein [Streptosporangiaceae bacterium NEAU-GS5]|nr:cupin domain-containing protein [Streptosporangiaceae bacterium NEAU-GS5]
MSGSSGGREPVREHPMKVTVEGVTADGALRAEDGWVNMNVKWLITADTVGSASTVFGITVFPPGARHEIHRHPHAEETEYIVEGHGIARVGDDDVIMGPGDIVFVPRDDYHGFVNTSETERAVMVWCYGGAASLEAAGYERE